ncbi:MAG: hypothetical protein ACRDJ4_08870 [Actinomycetota bacterium]
MSERSERRGLVPVATVLMMGLVVGSLLNITLRAEQSLAPAPSLDVPDIPRRLVEAPAPASAAVRLRSPLAPLGPIAQSLFGGESGGPGSAHRGDVTGISPVDEIVIPVFSGLVPLPAPVELVVPAPEVAPAAAPPPEAHTDRAGRRARPKGDRSGGLGLGRHDPDPEPAAWSPGASAGAPGRVRSETARSAAADHRGRGKRGPASS